MDSTGLIVPTLVLMGFVFMTVFGGATSANAGEQSIRRWVSCTGTSDDTAGVARAFDAAKNSAFTLVVDCPVRLHIGLDISRPVFIESGTKISFRGTGKFTVDNTLIPAFVIANSSNIELDGWDVEYDARLPIDVRNSGYVNNGQSERGLAGNAFNDLTLTPWLAEHRGIGFDRHQGLNAKWPGLTNPCAVFFLTGDTFNVSISALNLHVPPGSGVDRLTPVAFAMTPNYKSSQTIRRDMPFTGDFYALPHHLTFSNITLDGTYMGWVGNAHNVTVDGVHSYRYGDLEEANGSNTGGVGKWFAPPHLFYWSDSFTSDGSLFNNHITISNVVDHGIRLGSARDKGGTDTISGYALSLKLMCHVCSVNNYVSDRPDGFMDVGTSEYVTVSNASATYDSEFLNNVYPGWRFPSSNYTNITFENVILKDLANRTTNLPLGNATQNNNGLVFSNVQISMNRWAGEALPLPRLYGKGIDATLHYAIGPGATNIVRRQTESGGTTLQATPAAVKVGSSVSLLWATQQATRCTAGGSYDGSAWSGDVGTFGKRILKMSKTGTYVMTLQCRDGTRTSVTAVTVVVSK